MALITKRQVMRVHASFCADHSSSLPPAVQCLLVVFARPGTMTDTTIACMASTPGSTVPVQTPTFKDHEAYNAAAPREH